MQFPFLDIGITDELQFRFTIQLLLKIGLEMNSYSY